MGNPRIPVWVNGERCDGVMEAARRLSVLMGYKVSFLWVSRLVKSWGSALIGGVTVSAEPPMPERREEAPPPWEPDPSAGPRPLLRYPWGEAPGNRGVGRAER